MPALWIDVYNKSGINYLKKEESVVVLFNPLVAFASSR